jgi:branched-chain amino acid transport system ATP-binding protein
MSAILRSPAQALTEAAVARRVGELVKLFGLERYAERLVRELSTGVRRLVDLAGITAQSPRVILLDEPSSGIAQREVEELADVLGRLRTRLSATLVVVEHDIAFVRSFVDQLVALDQGAVVAVGHPDEVLDNDDVVASFLGMDPVTRQRSGRLDPLDAAVAVALVPAVEALVPAVEALVPAVEALVPAVEALVPAVEAHEPGRAGDDSDRSDAT